MNWVRKLQEVVKTPNKPNQRPKIQVLEQGDFFPVVCQCLLNV